LLSRSKRWLADCFAMNPLTQIKNTQKVTKKEIELGYGDNASWHARYKHSAYIFVGGLDYDLTEGDLLAVFAQYGEIVDVNLVKDKDTGKSKGFAFLAYEDQRSTVVAVDNLSGIKVADRTIRVEHVDDYKKKRKEVTISSLAHAGCIGSYGGCAGC
jgi:RNA-binding motif X-linked protein 2